MSNLGGLNFYGDYSTEDIILENIREFINYGLIELGAFINVNIGDLDRYGQDESRLYPVSGRPGVIDNTVFMSRRDDWIWENNISLKATGLNLPYVPSGIVFNNTFVPTGTDVSGVSWYLDFSRGRVVFSSGWANIPTVQVQQSWRYVSVYDSDSYQNRTLVRDWRETNPDTSGFEAKAYMPCISIGINNYRTIKGTQLGSRTKDVEADIQFDIFAATPSDRKRLSDICNCLETKGFKLFDPNISPKPLNYRGELVNSTYDWAYLVENYTRWPGIARFRENARHIKIPIQSNLLYRSRINIGLELNINPI